MPHVGQVLAKVHHQEHRALLHQENEGRKRTTYIRPCREGNVPDKNRPALGALKAMKESLSGG